jgi:hypothetical protein
METIIFPSKHQHLSSSQTTLLHKVSAFPQQAVQQIMPEAKCFSCAQVNSHVLGKKFTAIPAAVA